MLITSVPQMQHSLSCFCRKFVVKQLAQQLRPQLEATVKQNDATADEVYSPDAKSAARRAIKNKALAYLAALEEDAVTQQVLDRFRHATNMTDKLSALSALIDSEGELLQQFRMQFTSWITCMMCCAAGKLTLQHMRLLAFIHVS